MRNNKDSFGFVIRHYRFGAFRPVLRFVPTTIWRTRRIVAAAMVAFVLTAGACTLWFVSSDRRTENVVESIENHSQINEIKILEFNDAPLDVVIDAVEHNYGVRVSGYEPDENIRLTIRFEGTADELIEAINTIEGTHLSIHEDMEEPAQ